VWKSRPHSDKQRFFSELKAQYGDRTEKEMAKIKSFTLFPLNLPFRIKFKHAAAERRCSGSIILKCETASGSTGYGECLPREYVTGESQAHALNILRENILSHLIGFEFHRLEDVISFLSACNGKAPAAWASASIPQTAAWAAVDLALLDTFGKEFATPVRLKGKLRNLPSFRYNGVCSAEIGWQKIKILTLFRLFGFRHVKIKIQPETAVDTVRLARKILGRGCDISVDANMAWNVSQAMGAMDLLSRFDVCALEQPLDPHDMTGSAALVRRGKMDIMADESMHDAESLDRLISRKAFTAINVRISKCGGLVASYNRCLRALEAGLKVKLGSQVGETSLLSAAQLILISTVREIICAEGCFGKHLLLQDPAEPLLQFGYGGRPPKMTTSPGMGVRINEEILRKYSDDVIRIE
jgi:L-alanine-DL-glutamate epimerase-like enolase superfamily enzyme